MCALVSRSTVDRRRRRSQNTRCPFCPIHDAIGTPDQLLGIEHGPDAGRDDQLRVIHVDQGARIRQDHTGHALDVFPALRVHEQIEELISPVAAYRVFVATMSDQPTRDLLQPAVASGVPVQVIHSLEMVKIGKHDGRSPAMAFGERHGLRKAVIEQDPTGQACPRVVRPV